MDDWEPFSGPMSNWPRIPVDYKRTKSSVSCPNTHIVCLVYNDLCGQIRISKIDLKQIDHLPNLAKIITECYHIECNILYLQIDILGRQLTIFIENKDGTVLPEIDECFTEKHNLLITAEFSDQIDAKGWQDASDLSDRNLDRYF